MFNKYAVYLFLVSLLVPTLSSAGSGPSKPITEISTNIGSSGRGLEGAGGITIGRPGGGGKTPYESILEHINKEQNDRVHAAKLFIGGQVLANEKIVSETRDSIVAQAPLYFNPEVANEITNYANQAVTMATASVDAAKNDLFREAYYLGELAYERIDAIKRYVDSVVNGVVSVARDISDLGQKLYDSKFLQNVKNNFSEYFQDRKDAFLTAQKDAIRDILILSLCASGHGEGLELLKADAVGRMQEKVFMIAAIVEGQLPSEGAAVFEGTVEGLAVNRLISEEIGVLNAEASKIVETGQKLEGFDAKGLQAATKHIPILKTIRTGYTQEVTALKAKGSQLLESGIAKEEVARILSQQRREIGQKYKEMTPAELQDFIRIRNGKDYSDPLGPTFEELKDRAISKGLTGDTIFDKIIEQAAKPNRKLNEFIDSLTEIP